MSRPRTSPFWRTVTLLGLTAVLALVWMTRTRLRVPVLAESAYMGREVCAGCHERQAELWSGSHHDLAMQAATEESVLGDFDDATFARGGVTSTFSRRDERFYVHTEGPEGALEEYEIAYTFGVTPLQQYLVAFPGGRYQVLGVAWDARLATAGGQRWFHLYPDADAEAGSALHWTQPSQNWNTQCAECHSTDLKKGFDLASRSYETTWSEIDVSCEACHGPGSRHVEIAEAAAESGSGVESSGWGLVRLGDARSTDASWQFQRGATIASRVGPATTHVQIETCAHCHSRRAPLIARHLPGEALLDADRVSLLRDGLYYADGQILDEVYVYGSFIQSKMFAAGVECSDCHDPHSLEIRADGNALCSRCHLATYYDVPSHHNHPPTSAGARCVECHMPSTDYMVVDARRDHSLRIPRPDLSRSIGVPNACNRCHTDRAPVWAAQAVEDWFGPPEDSSRHFGEAIHAGREGNPTAAAPLTQLARDTILPDIVRASALSLLVGYPASRTLAAIREGIRDSGPLVRLGALQGLSGLPPEYLLNMATPLLEDSVRAVRVEASRILALIPRESRAPDQRLVIDRAVALYEEVQRTNADQSAAWVNLGNVHALQGVLVAAEADYRTALELDSTDLVAHLNLADLQRALGRDAVGEDVLVRALAIDPESPDLLHAMGLLRVRQGRAEEARELLARASAARPEDVRFAYVYGVALASTGDVPRGMRVLEQALARRPYDRDLLSALTAYARDRGDVERARAYAERLVEVVPDDPGAAELLRRLRATGG